MDDRWEVRLLFDDAKRKLMAEHQMKETDAFYFLRAAAGSDDWLALGEAARLVLDGSVSP